MITLAHPWMLSPLVFAAVALVCLATPVISRLLAQLIVGPHARKGRAALAVGRGSVGALALLVVLRIVSLAVPSMRGAPITWLDAVLGTPADGWYPSDVVLVLLPLMSAAAMVGTLVAARQISAQPSTSLAPPLDIGGTVALVLAPLFTLLFAWPTLATRAADVWGLDLLTCLLVCSTSLAVWTRAYDEPEPEPEPAPGEHEEATSEHLDVPASWRSAKAVSSADRPWYTADAASEGSGRARATAAWHAAGGAGEPPVALDEILDETDAVGRLIGDLPEPTASIFATATLLLATRELGLRALVIGREPQRRRDALRAALDELGSWPIGPLPAGISELREIASRREVPTVTFLTVDELSGDGLGLFMDESGGRPLCAALGLLLLPRVDRGTPLDVTHRLFTLRRLHLALAAASARPSVVAFGFSGRGTRDLVQRAFPGTEMREVPLRARSTAALSVWLADWRFQQEPGEPWARRAAAPVVEAGYPVRVTDPAGTFDADDVSIWAGDVRLDRDLDFGGAASVAILDDLWLLAAVRALPNRVETAQEGRHHALWGLVDTPVTRFLLEKGNVHQLIERGRLQPPRPLVGHANRAIGRTHLKAALHDGAHASHALRVVFGNSLVDEIVGKERNSDRHEVRLNAQGSPVRSAVVPRARSEHADVIRDTVTDRTLSVVDQQSGRTLRHIDALTAPTRYYPKRVFAFRGTRYEVPMHGLDMARERLEVSAVPPDRPLTTPRLVTEASPRAILEAPQRVGLRTMNFRLATFDVLVHERITGVRRGKDATVDYPVVEAKYRTRARGVFFDRGGTAHALAHLARSVDGVLRALLLVDTDDVDVIPVPAGWVEDWQPGIVAVDRHVQGMGVAEALDEHVVREALELVYAILHRCSCAEGCVQCTPREVLEDGHPAKVGVLALLGG